MKQLLTILSLFAVLFASAQQGNGNGNGKNYPADFNTYGVHYPRGNFDSVIHIPVIKDTVSIRDNSKYKDSAEIAIFQGELWYKLPKGFWKKSGGGNGGGGGIIDLSGYYPKAIVDSLLNAKSIDLIIDDSTLKGSGTNADPLRVNASFAGNSFNGTAPTLNTTQQAYPYTGYTVNTHRKIGYQFLDNGDGTVSIQTAFLDGGIPIDVTPGALTTTEGQTIITTDGQTIIFN